MSAKKLAMTAELREGTGKGTARAIRREKNIPAVIYGNKQDPVTISMNTKDFTLAYHKGGLFTTLIDITVDGKKEMVLTRDIQTHPVSDVVIHADFLRVSAKTKISVEVPVSFINEDKSPALNDRGILNVVRYTIELNCQATNIPENIEVNLEGKEYGDSVNASDANMPEGTSAVISDRDFTIATIVEPREAEEEETEETVEAGDVPSTAQEGDDAAEGEDKSE